MRNPKRKIVFVLAASDHGSTILNRLDYHLLDQRVGIGVGLQILEARVLRRAGSRHGDGAARPAPAIFVIGQPSLVSAATERLHYTNIVKVPSGQFRGRCGMTSCVEYWIQPAEFRKYAGFRGGRIPDA